MVALSSMEAKYIATANAAKHVIWLQSLYDELRFKQENSSILLLNNKLAIDLASDPKFHNQSKHIDICHHFICKIIDNNTLKLSWVPTAEMLANILTKALLQLIFEKLRSSLGMMPN